VDKVCFSASSQIEQGEVEQWLHDGASRFISRFSPRGHAGVSYGISVAGRTTRNESPPEICDALHVSRNREQGASREGPVPQEAQQGRVEATGQRELNGRYKAVVWCSSPA
jgi:hypothetical protein